MKNQTQQYMSVLIYQREENVEVCTPVSEEEYNMVLDRINSDEDKKLIFAINDLSWNQYIMALKSLKQIYFRPVSEVSEQVEGLVARLKKEEK